MPIFKTVWGRIYVAIATLSWGVLIAAFVLHALASWALLDASGETGLTGDFVTFAYYYVTTATTVGYGDLSPEGGTGRLAGALFLLPGSIALFTAFLGKAVSGVGNFWRRRLQGKGDFTQRSGHMLIVGWHGTRSQQLIEGLAKGTPGQERAVLLAYSLEENPRPELVDFIAAQSLSDLDAYHRAGAAGAATVVIRGMSDDDTLAGTLAAHAAAPNAHLVAHFQSEDAARLIRRQLPEVEVITSIATQLLVRSARDPGASRLAALMFSEETADTAFSVRVADECEGARYLDLFSALKRHHDITLIGLAREGSHSVDLNCGHDQRIHVGDTLFYIADRRMDSASIDWKACKGASVTAS